MTVKGMPDIDVPLHEREPHPCKRCKFSFFDAKDTELRYIRCGRSFYSNQCRYERHETGDCGPDAIFWRERGA